MKRKWKQMSRIIAASLAAVMIVTSIPQSLLTVNAAEITVPNSQEDAGEAVVETAPAAQNTEDGVTPDGDGSGAASKDSGAVGDNAAAKDPDAEAGGGETGDNTQDNMPSEADADTAGAGTGEDTGAADDNKPENGETAGDSGETEEGNNTEEDRDKLEAGEPEEDGNEIEADEPKADEQESDDGENGLDAAEVLGVENDGTVVHIIFEGSDWSRRDFIVYDSEGTDVTEDGLYISYDIQEPATFRVVPKTGYIVTDLSCNFMYDWSYANLTKTNVNGGYECAITFKEDIDTSSSRYEYIRVTTVRKASYEVMFAYSGDDIEGLVVSNGNENAEQQVSANTPVTVANEYGVTFKFKPKEGKSIAVSSKGEDDEYENGMPLAYTEVDSSGYYCYDLGIITQNITITMQEGWKVSFDYNPAEFEEFNRVLLEDYTWIPIEDTVVVAKGETMYFEGYVLEEYYACSKSVTDDSGNVYEPYNYDSESTNLYRVTPEKDMTIRIELIPMSLPVIFDENVIKNFNVTYQYDTDVVFEKEIEYDAGEKKINNIYGDYIYLDINFEVEGDSHFDRAELVWRELTHDYDGDEGHYEYSYEEIKMIQNEDGSYSSEDSFSVWSRNYVELRIIAGDTCTVSFNLPNEINLYGKNKNYGEMEIVPSEPKTIVKGDEYTFIIGYDNNYELSVPYITAVSGGETRELETDSRINIGMYDENFEWKYFYGYTCSITPTADTVISAVLKPMFIPFKYNNTAIKDIEINGINIENGAATLSEDGNSIGINNYEELNNSEISFTLEDNKVLNGIYYGYTSYKMEWSEWGENIDYEAGTSTYTQNIPIVNYDDVTRRYSFNVSYNNNNYPYEKNPLVSIDYIQIVADDECSINFVLPEDKKDYISIVDFNSYEELGGIDIEQPVAAAKGEEYLFKVNLGDWYRAATVNVTDEDNNEIPVKYYSRPEPNWPKPGEQESDRYYYYSFTPTKDSSTIHIDLAPCSIPIKYAESAIADISLGDWAGAEAAASELSSDKKSVDIWNFETLSFGLKLVDGKNLSRIFVRRFNRDENGNKTDGLYEEDIFYEKVNDHYDFAINPEILYYGDYYVAEIDVAEIEIVTDKINLNDCNITLDLDTDDAGDYIAKYSASEIEPKVTVTYGEGENLAELDANDYTVVYDNNKAVGEAKLQVRAKDGSDCTGSKSMNFYIIKADAPTDQTVSISTDLNDAQAQREINLSKLFTAFDMPQGEKGVKPLGYSVNVEDEKYTAGGVLDTDAGDPRIEIREEGGIQNHILIYTVNGNATVVAEKAVIVLNASFENYEDARLVIALSMADKETLNFYSYPWKSSKTYDAKPLEYAYDNLYVVDEDGNMRSDSDAIMEELKDSIKYRYTGYIYEGSQNYDSYEAPVNAGNYNLIVEISDENPDYKAEAYSLNFSIYRREITIKADPVTINVGDPLPDTFSYTMTDDGLLDGDRMDPEPVLSCEAEDTETPGTYKIIVDKSDVDIINSEGQSVRNNYYIYTENARLTITNIEKTQITLSKKDDTDANLTKTYDGEAFDGISLIEAKNGNTLVEDAQITVKYVGRGDTDYAESETAPVNAGTYTMKAKVSGSDSQYKSDEITLNITINKAAAPVLQDKEVRVPPVTVNTAGTLEIAGYFTGEYEAVSYGSVTVSEGEDILTEAPTINAQGVLSYTLKAGVNTGTAVIEIPVVFRNYENAVQKVNIALTNKTILTLSPNTATEVNREYNGSTYVLPENAVNIEGMPQNATDKPELTYTYTVSGTSGSVIPLHAGSYSVTVSIAESDDTYTAAAPIVINFEITKKTVKVTAKSGNWNKSLDTRPASDNYPLGYESESLAGDDEWVNGPTAYTYKYDLDGVETLIEDTDDAWNALDVDTVITVTPEGARAADDYDDYNIEYVSGTLTVTDISGDSQFIVPEIAPMTYTGSPLKPKVKVYTINNGRLIELTSKDYKVQYSNNKNAGTGTVTITGKGNYNSTITKTFTIEKASIGSGSENKALGITLKYTEQSLDTKETKLVTSLKYKKALKEGTDFTVTLTKQTEDADDETVVSKTNGKTPAKSPKGTDKTGAYKLHIEAMSDSNYSGYIDKTVYVAAKANLIKNAKIALKTKTLKWDDKDEPDYGNYDAANWKGFYLNPGEGKDFTVSLGGKSLTNTQTSLIPNSDSEYFISYTNNDKAGTATITITGDGKTYFGTKSATFKIQGQAFKVGNKIGNISLPDTLTAPETYTGNEVTKSVESLEIAGKTTGSGSEVKPAVLSAKNGDYTVEYKNNIKKGNATIILTANPESGYTGSIKKTFKIQAVDLKKAILSGRDEAGKQTVNISFGSGDAADEITGVTYGDVPYSKSGASISGLVFTNRAGNDLKAGTDYTVKYTYKDKTKKAGTAAVMTLKGKGNYTGKLDVDFNIVKADYENLTVSVASAKLGKKAVKPKVTVKDGKKALTVSDTGNKDVEVKYENNDPSKVETWLTAGAPVNDTAPTVTVTVKNENYNQTQPEVIILNIYKDKLTKSKITIKWHDGDSPNAYYMEGMQVKPLIDSIKYDNTVYNVMEIDGEYFACDDTEAKNKVFRITYGANNKSGKNKGSVTIEGLRLYGGKYTEKFTINPKELK